MQRNNFIFFAIIGLLYYLSSITCMAQGGGDPSARNVPINGDDRLSRRVTISEYCITLDSLLKKLSNPEVKIVATKDYAEQKLQVHLKNRSLSTIMSALSQLLPGSWTPLEDGKGYYFRMAIAASRKREDWWRLFQEERRKAFANISTNVLRTIQSDLRPLPGEQGEKEAEESRAERAMKHSLFAGLPAAIQAQFASHIDERPFYRKDRFRAGGEGIEEGATVVPVSVLSEGAQTKVRSLARQGGMQQPEFVLYTNQGFALFATISDKNGNLCKGASLLASDTAATQVLALDQNVLLQELKLRRLGKTAPEGWLRLAEYQKSRVWKNSLPDEPLDSPQVLPRRADILFWLQKQSSMEFLADYYTAPGRRITAGEFRRALHRPLQEELNHVALQYDLSWKRVPDSSLYLFRNNRWYRDDALEVSESLLHRWAIALGPVTNEALADDSQKVKPTLDSFKKRLDAQAEVADLLTPWQIYTGLKWGIPAQEYWVPFGESGSSAGARERPVFQEFKDFYFTSFADLIMEQRSTLKFYASLNVDQRERIINRGLTAQSLSPAQLQLAAYSQPLLHVALQQLDQPVLLQLVPKNKEVFESVGLARVRIQISLLRQ